MEKRLTAILACLFFVMGGAFAQIQVKGTIISSDDGEPLPGASVKVVGEKTGTVTDLNGQFTITVPNAESRLELTHIGMLRRVVKARNGMQIALDTDNTMLDEVMVVAFGQQTKSSFTGSAVVLNSDDLNKKITTNIADALTGSVAGLQIRGGSGAPGAGQGSINIRGIASMFAETDPLIVVDGAPYSASLSNIPQEDIESVTVLKDAASAALYGARGAAGVILITTKQGKSEKAQINVDMKWGANSRAIQDYDTFTDAGEFYETYYKQFYNYAFYKNGLTPQAANAWANNAIINGNTGLGYNVYTVPDGEQLIGTNGKLNPNATLGRTYTANGEDYYLIPDNWTDAAYRNGFRQEYNVNINGGGSRGGYYASIGYLNEDGVIDHSGYERFTARVKADFQARKWLKLGTNIGYVHSNTKSNPNLDTSLGATNMMYYTSRIAPVYPLFVRVKDANGNPIIRTDEYGNQQYDYGVAATNYPGLTRRFSAPGNPIGANMYNKAESEYHQLSGTFTLDIDFTDWLRFNSTNNLNLGLSNASSYGNPFYGPSAGEDGTIAKSQSNTLRQNYIQTLTFHKLFGQHDVQVLAGHEWYKTRTKYIDASAKGGFSPDIPEINAFAIRDDSHSYTSTYNVEGWFANALYNFDERYFVSASYRRDASSNFHPDNRWGNFWSGGVAWLLNKESFFKKLNANWVDQIKLKFSVGQQGNDGIGAWNYTDLYTLQKSGTTMAPTFAQIGNRDISWETTTNINLGLEWSLWNGRLTGSFDFYNKRISGLLFWLNVPESMGSRGYYTNLGDMRNRGVELNLSGDIIRTKNVKWNVSLNLAHNVTNIITLPESKKEVNGGFSQSTGARVFQMWYEEGKSLYNAFMPEYAGVNEQGQALYWVGDENDMKVSADGTLVPDQDKPAKAHATTTTDYNNASYYEQGSILPKVIGGFNTSLEVYGVDLSLSFDYQLGGKVYDTQYASLMSPVSSQATGANLHKDILNSWTPNNVTSDIPRFQYQDQYTTSTSTRFLTNASYLNFQSFTVGYTFPKRWVEKIKLSKIRVYAQGQNLCFWSARKGLDPRYSFDTMASVNVYSPVRTIMGGVQVSF